MKLGVIASSSNPQNLSLTFQGISLVALIPTIVVILKLFGLDISEEEITQIATSIMTVAGGLTAIWGIVRKFLPKKQV